MSKAPQTQAEKCKACPLSAECPVGKWFSMSQEPKTREERFNTAKTLLESGLSIIPIPFGKKFPKIKWKEFQLRRANLKELERWFLKDDNTIGIVTGKISNLVVVDLDSEAAMKWARENLPPTDVVIQTKRGEHWYYTRPMIEEAIRNKVKISIEGLTLDIDIRADGGFVMGIGAVHPDGGFYKQGAPSHV